MHIETFFEIYLLITLCGKADFESTVKMRNKLKNEGSEMRESPFEENGKIQTDDNANIVATTSSSITPCDAGSSETTCSMACNALVLYQPELNTPLKRFKVPTRTFEFAGRQLTIQQKWDDHGVAAVVWDSAVVLCEFLEREKHLVKNKNIIELGSGTGLVGLVAAYLGGNVTVTERESVLDNLHSIVKENIQDDKTTEINVLKLDWRDDLTNSFSPEYDLILGADIIYIEETFPDLQRTLLYLSNRPNCMILLSCKIRYEKDSKFLEKMGNDFTVKRLVYEPERDISIYKIKRKCIDQ